MSTCAKPIAFDTFVAYWCDDLDANESDALEAGSADERHPAASR